MLVWSRESTHDLPLCSQALYRLSQSYHSEFGVIVVVVRSVYEITHRCYLTTVFFFFFLCENIAPRSLSLLSSLGPALTSPLLPQNVQPVILHPIIERYCYVIRGLKGDVTQDDSQRRFLAQQSVAMLEQCCNYSKQCHNNVATLCCAKNRRCESSRETSP